ncbi:MAG: hypothetical protein IH955_06315, partial [Chloroflexi bacterium]|nr:hypothetical protein [Chloroflexota bacterium]
MGNALLVASQCSPSGSNTEVKLLEHAGTVLYLWIAKGSRGKFRDRGVQLYGDIVLRLSTVKGVQTTEVRKEIYSHGLESGRDFITSSVKEVSQLIQSINVSPQLPTTQQDEESPNFEEFDVLPDLRLLLVSADLGDTLLGTKTFLKAATERELEEEVVFDIALKATCQEWETVYKLSIELIQQVSAAEPRKAVGWLYWSVLVLEYMHRHFPGQDDEEKELGEVHGNLWVSVLAMCRQKAIAQSDWGTLLLIGAFYGWVGTTDEKAEVLKVISDHVGENGIAD